MVRFCEPVLVRVSVSDWLLPTCTFPKLRLAGFAVRVPLPLEAAESCEAPNVGRAASAHKIPKRTKREGKQRPDVGRTWGSRMNHIFPC